MDCSDRLKPVSNVCYVLAVIYLVMATLNDERPQNYKHNASKTRKIKKSFVQSTYH